MSPTDRGHIADVSQLIANYYDHMETRLKGAMVLCENFLFPIQRFHDISTKEI